VKAAAQGDEDRSKPTTPPRVGAHDSSVRPRLANDDGPRKSAIVTSVGQKKSRRSSIQGKAAAEVKFHDARRLASNAQSSTKASVPASEDSKPKRSAIITAHDRKTVQRQRVQQQMAKSMSGGEHQQAPLAALAVSPPSSPCGRSAAISTSRRRNATA
jgi:hypothetical protein